MSFCILNVQHNLVNLDTVWYIKCFDFSSKKLANEFVLEFLKQCVEQLKISRISISFNLSLTYLHSKPPYKNMTDILGSVPNSKSN